MALEVEAMLIPCIVPTVIKRAPKAKNARNICYEAERALDLPVGCSRSTRRRSKVYIDASPMRELIPLSKLGVAVGI